MPEPASKPLNTAEAALYVGVSKSTLEHLRTKGGGPVFEKPLPSIVRYTREALDAWRASKTFRHTAEAPRRPRKPQTEGGADVAA